jgi:hypothetical protein
MTGGCPEPVEKPMRRWNTCWQCDGDITVDDRAFVDEETFARFSIVRRSHLACAARSSPPLAPDLQGVASAPTPRELVAPVLATRAERLSIWRAFAGGDRALATQMLGRRATDQGAEAALDLLLACGDRRDRRGRDRGRRGGGGRRPPVVALDGIAARSDRQVRDRRPDRGGRDRRIDDLRRDRRWRRGGQRAGERVMQIFSLRAPDGRTLFGFGHLAPGDEG